VYNHTIPETIKRALSTGYRGVHFELTKYLVSYKCDKCGHEWDLVHNSYGVIPESEKCRMGCSEGADGSIFGFFKIIASLFTKKPPFGYGRLISQKEL